MGAECRWSLRPLVVLALALATVCAPVSGGPDHSFFTPCLDLFKSLKSEQRHVVRDLVQSQHAIESYIGHLRLGRPLPESSVPAASPNMTLLEEWRVSNASRLLHYLEDTGMTQRLGLSTTTAAALAASCLSSQLQPDGFTGHPVVSVLLNYFKRPHVVKRMVASMRRTCEAAKVPCELVVNVDNPHEAGSWAAEVAAGFVVPVFSANLHEARGYNRAAGLAQGRYLVIWQDDQVPPESGQWLVDMIKTFDAYPQLGILGMNTYRLCKHMEPTNRWGQSHWDKDPRTGVRWTYAQTVDFAPLAIRASIFEAVGGLDEGLARPGDCGIWGDWELSARAWMDGWQVGHMAIEGRGDDGEPGTTHVGANGEKCWGRQQHIAMNVYHKRYGTDKIANAMCERVWLLNMLTFKLTDNRCPYGSEETRYANCTAPLPEVAAEVQAVLAELEAVARGRGVGKWSAAAPTDETPTDGTPTDETPTDGTPTDETPTNETELSGLAEASADGMAINPLIVRGSDP